MASALLRSGAFLVLVGGLALLSSTAILGIILIQGIFASNTPPVFTAVVLFLAGLTVAVLGAGVFLWGFAKQAS